MKLRVCTWSCGMSSTTEISSVVRFCTRACGISSTTSIPRGAKRWSRATCMVATPGKREAEPAANLNRSAMLVVRIHTKSTIERGSFPYWPSSRSRSPTSCSGEPLLPRGGLCDQAQPEGQCSIAQVWRGFFKATSLWTKLCRSTDFTAHGAE